MPELQTVAAQTDGIRVVQQFFSAVSAFDFDRALSMMTDDVIYQNVPFPADIGKPAVERTLRLFGRLDVFEVRMHNIAQRGDIVLTERTDIVRAPFIDLSFWACGTFEIREGKIALWRDRFDVGDVVRQFLLGPLRKLRLSRG